ncbi:MAG TPA: hypothetical protein PKV40_05620 [Candidatus Kapabacteria bacterium]|nr:hypothetical protein [Candidatus Kapabacteria bacterium]HRT67417.1 hypothetical protein [Bacteroidota bacterium]
MKKIQNIIKSILLFILLLLTYNSIYAQSGITFPEFSKRLEVYFDKDMILDIKKYLPSDDKYLIWGMDVGDFSGDGNNDVAVSIKILNEKQKVVRTYLFVDMYGYFVKVGEFQFPFIDLPLEVGANIKDGTCYITQKISPSNWNYYGYRFDKGVLINSEKFSSTKLDFYTIDKNTDYLNLKVRDVITENKTNFEKYRNEYSLIPAYYRGRLIYTGYQNKLTIDKVENAIKGAYFWQGPEDCYFEVYAVYDDEYLYFNINIYDDKIIPKRCDSCTGDFVNIWFNTNLSGEDITPYQIKGSNIIFPSNQAKGVYCFTLAPGDFVDIPSFVNVSSNDYVSSFQQLSTIYLRTSSNLIKNGYNMKIRIPFNILSIDPLKFTKNIFEIACSIEVHDIDNEFRPDEETVLATSNFDFTNPASFGKLLIIPNNQWLGGCQNVYKQDILQTLLEYGY